MKHAEGSNGKNNKDEDWEISSSNSSFIKFYLFIKINYLTKMHHLVK
jgi:hypothetical protein